MSDFAKKALVFLIAAGIAGYFSFNWARDVRDRSAEYGEGVAAIEKAQCVQQFGKHLPGKQVAEGVCDCTIAEFQRRGLEVSGMLTGDRAEMQEITDACFRMYS